MNNEQEKRLQEHLFETIKSEKETSGPVPEDDRLYHLIFDALEETEEFDIPRDFVAKTVRTAIRKKNLLDLGRLLAMYLGVGAILLACSATVLYFFGDGILKNIQEMAILYKWPLLFCAGMFLVIQLADDVLIKRKTYRI